jgi:hypothetical protein
MKNSEVRIVNDETDAVPRSPRNQMECWSDGVMGRWSNLATHLAEGSDVGFLNRRERRKRSGNPYSKSALRYLRLLLLNPTQSCLIKPNRAIFPCFDMATRPKTAKFRNCQLPRSVRSDRSVRSGSPQLAAPSCHAEALPRRSEAKAGQSQSNPVKPRQTIFQA